MKTSWVDCIWWCVCSSIIYWPNNTNYLFSSFYLNFGAMEHLFFLALGPQIPMWATAIMPNVRGFLGDATILVFQTNTYRKFYSDTIANLIFGLWDIIQTFTSRKNTESTVDFPFNFFFYFIPFQTRQTQKKYL